MDGEATAPLAEVFGLAGFDVLAAADAGGEPEVIIETPAGPVPCPGCGAVATAKDRRATWAADLPIAGRPVALCWVKRIWTCRYPRCSTRSWTERHSAIAPRAVRTERAAAGAVDDMAQGATVAGRARGLGVGWHTINRQVIRRGAVVVDDPARLAGVSAIGVDEHRGQSGTHLLRSITRPASLVAHPDALPLGSNRRSYLISGASSDNGGF